MTTTIIMRRRFLRGTDSTFAGDGLSPDTPNVDVHGMVNLAVFHENKNLKFSF